MKAGPIAGQHLSFHAALENWAEGMNYCAVPVPATITAALGRVRFTVLDRAQVDIPDDLRRALAADKVTDAFTSLPPGKQQYIIRRIDEAVKTPTRVRRIQEAVAAAQQRREQLIDDEAAG